MNPAGFNPQTWADDLEDQRTAKVRSEREAKMPDRHGWYPVSPETMPPDGQWVLVLPVGDPWRRPCVVAKYLDSGAVKDFTEPGRSGFACTHWKPITAPEGTA